MNIELSNIFLIIYIALILFTVGLIILYMVTSKSIGIIRIPKGIDDKQFEKIPDFTLILMSGLVCGMIFSLAYADKGDLLSQKLFFRMLCTSSGAFSLYLLNTNLSSPLAYPLYKIINSIFYITLIITWFL